MKRIVIFILMALCLTFTTSCSKDKAKADTKQSKTVDLGETDDVQDDGDKKADKKADGDKKLDKKSAKKDDKKADKKNDAKSAKVAKNARLEPENEGDKKAEEKAQEPDNPKDEAKPEADTPEANEADEKPAPETAFDFSDDEHPKDNVKPLPPKPRMPKPRITTGIEKYINIKELREETGFSGALSEAWLDGQENDPRYSSARLATDNNDELGFTIQVWKPGNENAASKRFTDLFEQSFGGQKIKNLASDAFTSHHHKINELAFFEKSKRSTVLLSCSDNICSIEQLKTIAQTIQRRL